MTTELARQNGRVYRFMQLWDRGEVLARHEGRELRYGDLAAALGEKDALRGEAGRLEERVALVEADAGEAVTHLRRILGTAGDLLDHAAAEQAREFLARLGPRAAAELQAVTSDIIAEHERADR